MASVNIDYNCGCGFTTRKLEEATEHADSNGHSLTVCGNIKAPKAVKEYKLAAKSTARRAPVRIPEPEPETPDSGVFDDLRSKLYHAKGSE